MGLDASVYCNCYETRILRVRPKPEFDVYVTEQGAVECRNTDLATQMEFDSWKQFACEHEDMRLIHHRIGNWATVEFLREELSRRPEGFPLILGRVVNSAFQDTCIAPRDVRSLREELRSLFAVRCADPDRQWLIDRFHSQLTELVECALAIGKPIALG